MIDAYYNDIVAAFQRASCYAVCRVPTHSLKPRAAEPPGPGGQLTPTFSGAGSTYGA